MKKTLVPAGRRPLNFVFVPFQFFFSFVFEKEPLCLKEIFSKIFVRWPILYSKLLFICSFKPGRTSISPGNALFSPAAV